MIKYCLFDLDGTLVKSEEGIIDSVIYALGKCGVEEKDRTKLKAFIGPALYDSFTTYYGFDQDTALRAVEYYREVYEDGNLFKASLYDGVIPMLEDIRMHDRVCILVSSKPYIMAHRVMSHLGIDVYFEDFYTPELTDTSSDKSDLIRRFLEDYNIGDRRRVAMIGDKSYDMAAAKACSVVAIGVTYGYGSENELVSSGADILAESPIRVCKLL